MLLAVLIIGKFLGAAIFWGWALQSGTNLIRAHWQNLERTQKVFVSVLLLYVLFLALESLTSFDKYFKILFGE